MAAEVSVGQRVLNLCQIAVFRLPALTQANIGSGAVGNVAYRVIRNALSTIGLYNPNSEGATWINNTMNALERWDFIDPFPRNFKIDDSLKANNPQLHTILTDESSDQTKRVATALKSALKHDRSFREVMSDRGMAEAFLGNKALIDRVIQQEENPREPSFAGLVKRAFFHTILGVLAVTVVNALFGKPSKYYNDVLHWTGPFQIDLNYLHPAFQFIVDQFYKSRTVTTA